MSNHRLDAALKAASLEFAIQVANAPGDVNRYVAWSENDNTDVYIDGNFDMEAVIKAAVVAAISQPGDFK